MIPDRKYRVAVRRLHVIAWAASVCLLVAAVAIVGRFPVAGMIVGLGSLGTMRLAAEVRDEMSRWGTDRSARPVNTYDLFRESWEMPVIRVSDVPWSALTHDEQTEQLTAAGNRGILDVPVGLTAPGWPYVIDGGELWEGVEVEPWE